MPKPLTAAITGLGKSLTRLEGKLRARPTRLMKASAERVLWVLGSLQVGAGGEGAARLVAGQDDGAHLVVVRRLVEMADQALGIILPPAVPRLADG